MARWRSSGRSAADYAKERGLKAGTLLWWSGQLRREPLTDVAAQPTAGDAVAFLPLRVRESESAQPASVSQTASVEVILENGRRVRVLGDVDVGLLKRVLAAADGADPC